jgi:hypothetical protein
MAYEERQKVEMTDFQGMMTNVSLMDIPPGASEEQVNLVSVSVGELAVRQGVREVTFES